VLVGVSVGDVEHDDGALATDAEGEGGGRGMSEMSERRKGKGIH
jgi:hypothetical protein